MGGPAVTTVLGALLGTLLGVAAAALTAAPAAAHTALEASSPGDGTRLKTAPAQVTLEFTEPVRSNALMRVDVRSAGGRQFAVNRPRVSGEKVIQLLEPLTAVGKYEVNFRVVALDGHLVSGALRFTLDNAAGDEDETAEPGAAAPAPLVPARPAAADDDESDVPVWGIGLGVLGACVVVVGAAWIGRQVTRDLD